MPLDLGEALWIAHWAPMEQWAQAVMQRSLAALEALWQAGAVTQLDARLDTSSCRKDCRGGVLPFL